MEDDGEIYDDVRGSEAHVPGVKGLSSMFDAKKSIKHGKPPPPIKLYQSAHGSDPASNDAAQPPPIPGKPAGSRTSVRSPMGPMSPVLSLDQIKNRQQHLAQVEDKRASCHRNGLGPIAEGGQPKPPVAVKPLKPPVLTPKPQTDFRSVLKKTSPGPVKTEVNNNEFKNKQGGSIDKKDDVVAPSDEKVGKPRTPPHPERKALPSAPSPPVPRRRPDPPEVPSAPRPVLPLADNKPKYKKRDLPPSNGTCPVKPPRPLNVVLPGCAKDVATRRLPSLPPGGKLLPKAKPASSDEEEAEPEEEMYDDIEAVTGATSGFRPVSLIPPMTEDEEDDTIEETYDDIEGAASVISPRPGLKNVPEEIYDDNVLNTSGGSGEEDGDIYEEFDGESEISSTSTGTKPDLEEKDTGVNEKEERERKKQEEKEKKLREKLEKEQAKKDEKERKKREKEEKAIKTKFKIEGEIVVVSKGRILELRQGGKLDLVASAGEMVDVILKEDNPEAKLFARSHDGKYGYVDVDNIQVGNLADGDDGSDDVYDDTMEQDECLYEAVEGTCN